VFPFWKGETEAEVLLFS